MTDEWQEPVRLNDEGLLITVSTSAQARNWLQHTQRKGSAWEEALTKCAAATEGRLPNSEARAAFMKAAH